MVSLDLIWAGAISLSQHLSDLAKTGIQRATLDQHIFHILAYSMLPRSLLIRPFAKFGNPFIFQKLIDSAVG